MSPGLISRVVVAGKTAAIRRMRDGIRSLPLGDLAAFTADPRMVAAGDSYLRRALEALLESLHPCVLRLVAIVLNPKSASEPILIAEFRDFFSARATLVPFRLARHP